MGISFHQGYLSEFGVTIKLFPLTFNETLLKGFAATTSILWSNKWYILAAMIIIYLLLMILAFIEKKFLKPTNKESNKEKEDISKSRDKTSQSFLKNLISVLEWVGNFLYTFVISLSVFVVIVLSIIHVSQDLGKKTALKLKENFKTQLINNEKNGVKVINYFRNESKKTGVIISHSSNYILIYTENFTPLILNNSTIEYFQVVNQ